MADNRPIICLRLIHIPFEWMGTELGRIGFYNFREVVIYLFYIGR